MTNWVFLHISITFLTSAIIFLFSWCSSWNRVSYARVKTLGFALFCFKTRKFDQKKIEVRENSFVVPDTLLLAVPPHAVTVVAVHGYFEILCVSADEFAEILFLSKMKLPSYLLSMPFFRYGSSAIILGPQLSLIPCYICLNVWSTDSKVSTHALKFKYTGHIHNKVSSGQ